VSILSKYSQNEIEVIINFFKVKSLTKENKLKELIYANDFEQCRISLKILSRCAPKNILMYY